MTRLQREALDPIIWFRLFPHLNLLLLPIQAIREEHKAIEIKEEQRGSSKVKSWTKKMHGRVWMAESFPLATSDLVPLLQILRCVNKSVKIVSDLDDWETWHLFSSLVERMCMCVCILR